MDHHPRRPATSLHHAPAPSAPPRPPPPPPLPQRVAPRPHLLHLTAPPQARHRRRNCRANLPLTTQSSSRSSCPTRLPTASAISVQPLLPLKPVSRAVQPRPYTRFKDIVERRKADVKVDSFLICIPVCFDKGRGFAEARLPLLLLAGLVDLQEIN